MGNHNTTGILGEGRATNDESQEPNLVCCSKQEDQMHNDDKQNTIVTVAQLHDIPVVRSPPSKSEEINESFSEDNITEESDLHDLVSCNVEESKESNLELEACQLNEEEDDQPSNPKGYQPKADEISLQSLHQPELKVEPDLTTEFEEAVEITLQQEELQNIILVKETMETTELCDAGKIQKAKTEESLSPTDNLKTDILDAQTEQVVLELGNHTENSEDGYEIKTREEPDKEVKNGSDFLPVTSSPDKAPERNEMPDKSLILTEMMEMEHELHSGVNSTFSDQTRPHAQELNHTVGCTDAESDKKEIVDEIGFSKSESILPQLIVCDEENVVAKEIGLLETESSTEMNKNQEISTVEEGMSQLLGIEPDLEQCVETITKETQVPVSLLTEKHFNTGSCNIEKAVGDCIQSVEDNNVKVELRKSSSFDFGLPFDARSEETDQTPLLYQDKTALRSFSTCSTLINYKVSDQVEEKTIRMEKGSSENTKSNIINLVKNEEKSTSDEKQQNSLKAENISENCSNASPKGNEKLKRKYSLFTACICCTAEA